MTAEEKARAQKCVEAWRRAGPELERMRRDEIRHADTALSIPAFDGLFEGAIRDFPARPTSGLVEQQRFFRRAKR
jgi:demethoxyubiquinone hydroxylase (CLK1/Coq7/Cat5 family)